MTAVARTFARFVLATVLTGFVLVIGVGAGTAGAATGPFVGEEARFVTLVNAVRADAGQPPLAVDPELTKLARDWAATMADDGLLAHNLNLSNLVTAEWTRLGENVGQGTGVDQLMDLFVASPHHYSNIIDSRFTRIGVGVVHDRLGQVWTAHEFMRVQTAASAPPAPAPSPAPAPTKAPATTAPPPSTTAAPPVAPTSTAPAPTELAASYPAAMQNDVLPDVHEVALAAQIPPMNHERGHADALAMILFAIALGSLGAAGALKLRGSA